MARDLLGMARIHDRAGGVTFGKKRLVIIRAAVPHRLRPHPFRLQPIRHRVALGALALAAIVNLAAAATLAKWTGGKTPLLRLADAGGKHLALAELRGKTVVVNFWATWCEPCREEMPSLERLRAQLAGRPFEVVAVNVGESPERVARFARDVPVTFPILYDREGTSARAWKVRGYPTSFVVGPDGRIRYYFVGELDWSRADVVTVIEGVR
jgi:thiol-disulfide isomerase/thioredoxin